MVSKKLIKDLFTLLDEKNLTISSVESFTGGLFGSSLTSVAGSSKYYLGSIISYNTNVKINLLNIDKELINKYTVVSAEVAYEMAKNGRKLLNSDICVSFTGNAGPGVCEGDKPAGLFYIGICYKNKNGENVVETSEYSLEMERNLLRETAVKLAIKKIFEIFGKKF